MYNRKLAAMLAVAAGTLAFAGSAQATTFTPVGQVVVDNDPVQVLTDPEVTLVDGNVAFTWGNGTTGSRLTGTLHIVNGDDASFRVKVASFDRAGTNIGNAYDDSAGHAIHTDAAKDIPVDMTAKSAPYVHRVEVSVQKKSDTTWHTKQTNNTPYLTLHDDDVKLLGVGLDLGSSGFLNGAPTGPAKMHYTLADDGKMTASLTETLHFDDFERLGRVQLRSLPTFAGLPSINVTGPQHSAPDDGYYHYTDTITTAPSSGTTSVQVAMQSKTGGVWGDLPNTQTVSIAE
jgi:hypothetical protein